MLISWSKRAILFAVSETYTMPLHRPVAYVRLEDMVGTLPSVLTIVRLSLSDGILSIFVFENYQRFVIRIWPPSSPVGKTQPYTPILYYTSDALFPSQRFVSRKYLCGVQEWSPGKKGVRGVPVRQGARHRTDQGDWKHYHYCGALHAPQAL